ncbi:uncharacterized protein LOC115927670 [Strongylocentrotus purpuratus]|uniref:Uncharacterized protein n=1 Tax=Strongylocentrotus purpuratus TaxID=7668 RepID=A0A7M7PEY9_STRPU|nr:uncharacterized protein LOC115927670 [Strongylocentrotus purpuratus]
MSGRWQFLVAFLALVLALPALGVDVGGGVVEVSLPDVTEELPEPEGVLGGDCMNISLRNNDWSWDGDEGQQDQGETALLVRKLLQRLNNETQRIQNDNPNLNLTHFMRLVASRSSLMLLKIKSFARVFGHVNALYGYTCRNGKQLLRHALQRNITDDELEEFDDEISAEIDAMVDDAMEEGAGGGEEERKGGEPGTVTGGKPNEALSVQQKNRAAVRLFIRKAVIGLFLSPRKLRGKEIPHLSVYINKLRHVDALSDLDPSQSKNATNRGEGSGLNREAGHTEDAMGEEGDMTGMTMEEDEYDVLLEIFESADWFDDDDPELRDDEEVLKKFNLEGYLFKLMSQHVNKSASCARDVTKFINKRAKHLSNVTDGEEDFKELWNEFRSLNRQLNASRHRNSTGGLFGSRGESSGHTETQTGNPLQGDGDIMTRIRNITGRLAKGRWRGEGGIEGSFYVVLMKMAHMIDSWGRAGFLSNGTYFDAKCAPGQSASEGATTACHICPTDAATRNLRMLLSELDDTIGEVYDGIKDGVDKLAEGPAKDQLTVYRLPRLALAETQITLSDKDKCTPFTLTYNIPQPGEGDTPAQPSTDGADQDERGTEGDGETREVISYEDFSTLREEQFSLPAVPFLLGNQDAQQSLDQSRRITIDEASFVSDSQLTVEGRFCEMDSRVLQLCLTLDGRTRIRTDDAPEGKCHNLTVYAAAPAVSGARLSDRADAIIVFFDKDVNVANLKKCSAIFDETSVAKFGDEAECQWRKGRELVVRLGKGATINPQSESRIALRPDHIRAFRQLFSHTASGMVEVLLPNNPVTPTALIDGEPKVPECGDIRLSALRSKGGGSRGLTYTWSIQRPTEDVDERITNILARTNGDNKAELVVGASLLSDDTPYVMRLTVSNILGLENSTTFTVRKANEQEPKFKIGTIGIPADKVVNVNKP